MKIMLVYCCKLSGSYGTFMIVNYFHNLLSRLRRDEGFILTKFAINVSNGSNLI